MQVEGYNLLVDTTFQSDGEYSRVQTLLYKHSETNQILKVKAYSTTGISSNDENIEVNLHFFLLRENNFIELMYLASFIPAYQDKIEEGLLQLERFLNAVY